MHCSDNPFTIDINNALTRSLAPFLAAVTPAGRDIDCEVDIDWLSDGPSCRKEEEDEGMTVKFVVEDSE